MDLRKHVNRLAALRAVRSYRAWRALSRISRSYGVRHLIIYFDRLGHGSRLPQRKTAAEFPLPALSTIKTGHPYTRWLWKLMYRYGGVSQAEMGKILGDLD